MTTTVTESNQVSIPPDIAREFDIYPGTRLEWAKGGEGVITLKPLPSRGALARQLMGAGRHLLKPEADHIGDYAPGLVQRFGYSCGLTMIEPSSSGNRNSMFLLPRIEMSSRIRRRLRATRSGP